VPFIWSAADIQPEDALLEWTAVACEGMQAERFAFQVGALSASPGFKVCWQAMRAAIRSWGVRSPQGLSAWMANEGLGEVRPHSYFGRVEQ
jgi:hypothetical protein